ncbi:DUF6011 domain-containing protein [Bacillus suaedae]|uniref:Uncharacterized protein n=1 Tax=Halalkalibacter suaedae TaxID=2822140 RepID=A0A940WU73_9BACI|nr:DUF6011 domain-containing protein [Bacillus suaedae]MBP3950313.1 hypothetical protein [Bacillus suaedae]
MSPENRLIDALIATKVMGMSNVTRTGRVSAVSWYDHSGNYVCKIRDYKPTEKLEQAFKLLRSYESYTLTNSSDNGHVCELWKGPDNPAADTEADTPSLAISLAIIDANKIDHSQYRSADDLLKKDVIPFSEGGFLGGGSVSMTCGRCNRPLRSTESQVRGYGPECWKKEVEQSNLITLLSQPHEDKENFMDELNEQKVMVG